MKSLIRKLREEFGLEIRDEEIIRIALTHTSFREYNAPINFERLEFLGDSVVNLLVSEYLFKKYPNEKEGELSKKRSYLISEKNLSYLAKKLKLNEFILLGRGEELDKGREKERILCDTFEAFIASLYLQLDFNSLRNFFNLLLDEYFPSEFLDTKTKLQEITQEKFKVKPEYILLEERGPEHNKEFEVGVYIKGKLMGLGKGKSKKEAEKEAAREAIERLGEE